MNAPEPAQSFEAARRRHLIEATIETLADVGFKAASLAEIARRADVSTGLFAHYFGDKDGLLEATLRFMAARLTRATAARLREASSPRARLQAVAESALAAEEFDRRTSAVWLAFWGQIMHSDAYRRVQSIYQRRMLSNLRHGLRGLVAPDRIDACARMISAAIDGLWLQSHASEAATSDGRHARAMVRDLIDALIAGAAAGDPATRLPAGAAQASIDGVAERARQGADAWRATPMAERARILRDVAAALRADAPALARLEAEETGRPIRDVVARDIPRAIRAFERAAARTAKPSPERIAFGPTTFGHLGPSNEVRIGVGHWSAALVAACRHAAQALGAGEPVVFALPKGAPRTARRLADILRAAGLPEGGFGLVDGPAASSHPAAVAVVFEDADLDRAAACVLHGAPFLSETRVFVAAPAQPAFRKRLVAAAKRLRIGDPLDPATDIGPMAAQAHLDAAIAAIGDARRAGARIVLDGRRADGRNGAFLAPTVMENCSEDMRIAQGGLFAPVAPLLGFDDEAALVRRLDALAPRHMSVFSREPARGRRFADRIAGPSTACVNDFECADDAIEDWLDGPEPRPNRLRVLVRYESPPEM